MKWLSGGSNATPPSNQDSRDTVGQNPTGNARRSSGGKRRQEAKKDPKKS